MKSSAILAVGLLAVFLSTIVAVGAVAKDKNQSSQGAVVIIANFADQNGQPPDEIPKYKISKDTPIQIALKSWRGDNAAHFTVRVFLNDKTFQSFQDIVQAENGSLDLICLLRADQLQPGKNTILVNVIAGNGAVGRGKARVRYHEDKKSR